VLVTKAKLFVTLIFATYAVHTKVARATRAGIILLQIPGRRIVSVESISRIGSNGNTSPSCSLRAPWFNVTWK
jgi:hypothetical protein